MTKIILYPLLVLVLSMSCSAPPTAEIAAKEFTEEVKNIPSLSEVSHWLYLLEVNLDSETLNLIAESEYDMVVIDFIPSEENNIDYPIAGVIDKFHHAHHPKLVIAYIDIGQAEDYRTYWQSGWEIGEPEWIVSGDPDGWEGNYPVAYWYDEYQEIWVGEGGYLESILEAGFDGVYLDWIEAFSDGDVVDMAEDEGLDPVEEMIWWVGDIADFTKNRVPGFYVIAQNAAELAAYDEYVEIIDAIAQEQIWFDGGADNLPPGDCPLPRTDADIDTKSYYQSLPDDCRRVYEQYPESTLHVSSEEYLDYLAAAQDKGLTIFTVDYALDPVNINWIYQTSRNLGFIPFVSNRALDQYIPPVP